MSNPIAPGAISERPSRTTWIAGGLLALASVAAATGIALRPSTPTAPVAQSPAPVVAAVSREPAPAPEVTKHLSAKPVPHEVAAHAAVPAASCKQCGVVESVHQVTHKGQGRGIGAVAGGVLGAAVGNQMGHGNGRAAMTVLGAVGGGFAGNEIERRTKSETVYEVRVRLDDGTLRTFEQHSAPALGTHVVIEGNALKTLPVSRG